MFGLIKKIPFYFITLLRLTKDEDFDVIHCHDMHTIFSGLVIAKLRKCKSVYDAHDIYYLNSGVIGKSVIKKIDLFFAKLFDLILVPCDVFNSYFSRVNRNVATIWNVPEHDVYIQKEIDSYNKFLDDIIGSKTKYIISYFGSFRFRKPFFTLFEAVKNLDNVYICLSGAGKCLKEIEYLSYNYDNVKIIPLTTPEGVIERYRKTNCLFSIYPHDHPVIKYSIPMKIFDAMAFGLPVIVNNIGYTSMFVEYNNIGYTVNEYDTDALRNCIIKLINDTKNIKGKNGRRLIEEIFNWDRESKKLIERYRKMT
jgi:glycosyltransferase involved in cell wall biosynthesis